MKKIAKGSQVVALATAKKPMYSGYSQLYYSDYDSPNLNGLRPCLQDAKGVLTDLRTGEVVQMPSSGAALWNVTVGTVFEYPDGHQILLSRLINKERSLALYEGNEFTFSPTSMVKHFFREHQVKDVRE